MEDLRLAPRPTRELKAPPVGRPVKVIANTFMVTRMPTVNVYQYEVVFDPVSYTGGDPKRENRNKNMDIIDACKRENPQIFANIPTVYDGKRIMFAVSRLFQTSYGALPATLDNMPFTVKLKEVSIIQPGHISALIEGKGHAFDPNHLMSIVMLQLLLSEHSRQQKYPYYGRKMFPPGSRLCDLGGGLELVRAFIHMIRPSVGKLIVMVGIGSGAMYKSHGLIDLAFEFLNTRDIRHLERLDLTSKQGIQLSRFLKNVKIRSRMNPKPEVRRKVQSIKGLVAQAGKHEFSHDDHMITVERYYQNMTNRRVEYPFVFGVRLGKDAVVPAEFCEIVPGQLYRTKFSPELIRKVQDVTKKPPQALKQEIIRASNSQELNFQGSLYLSRVNMEIDTQPMKFLGRMLEPPKIRYGESGVCTSQDGRWNMLKLKFQEPAHIEAWSVVVFDTSLSEAACNVFLQILCNCMLDRGIRIDRKPPRITVGTPDISGSLNRALGLAKEGLSKDPKNGIIIAILPESAADLKIAIKRWGDIVNGVATQCVISKKLRFHDVRDNKGSQYCNNLALKINVKCGGINNSVVGDKFKNTMIIGADVSHPGPGQQKPSMTSLVYSIDDAAARYEALTSIQEPGLEMIQDMDDMVYDALKNYREHHQALGINKLPLYMLFYRDGVSEGELGQVVAFEIKKVKDGIQRYWKEKFSNPSVKGPNLPRLTFIVCGKRHHAKFFPETQAGADAKGNFLPGLVVDTDIVHPILFDFYLQSHAGLIGTSRSAHYTVVYDESHLQADFIQQLTYDLCFVYARATRSVSIPAPVYYADIACERVSNHFPENVYYESEAATDRSNFDMAQWRRQFRSANKNQAKRFYFM